MKFERLPLATLCLGLLPLACSSSGGGGGGGGDDPGGDSGPQLEAADLPSVSPCPDQDVLTTSSELADFKTALLQGNFLYLDVPFDGGDADIYKKKCGFEAFWDPSDNTDEIPPTSPPYGDPPTIADFFQFGNAGICTVDYASNFLAGFPEAGVYRKEFKVSSGGVSYHVRVRVTVAGSAAGTTFASNSISVPSDIENTLGYLVNGSDTAHTDLLPAIVAALEAPGVSASLEILDAPGGNTLLTAEIEFLCVSKS